MLMMVAVATPVRGQEIRDSNRVRIVTYGVGGRPFEAWSVAAQPMARIGGEDAPPEAHFQMVPAIALLPGGTLAIAALQDGEIRVFGPTGNYLRTIGRRGSGPGEFASIWEVWYVNNQLIGIDQAGTAQVFDTLGRYVRTSPRISTPNGRAQRAGFLDGSPVGSVVDPVPAGAEATTGTMSVLRFGRDSAVTLGHFPAWEIVRRRTGPPDFLRFGPRLAIATMSDRVCTGYGTRYVISCVDPHGRLLVRTERKDWKARSVTEEDKRLYFMTLDRMSPSERAAPYRERARLTTVFAERHAAFGRFVSNADDELWVGPTVTDDGTTNPMPAPREPTVWSVFAKDGRWIADATLPARFILLAVRGDVVAGLLRSADNLEEAVVTYRLRKTGMRERGDQ